MVRTEASAGTAITVRTNQQGKEDHVMKDDDVFSRGGIIPILRLLLMLSMVGGADIANGEKGDAWNNAATEELMNDVQRG